MQRGVSRKVRRGEFLAEPAEGVLAKCAEGDFSQSTQSKNHAERAPFEISK